MSEADLFPFEVKQRDGRWEVYLSPLVVSVIMTACAVVGGFTAYHMATFFLEGGGPEDGMVGLGLFLITGCVISLAVWFWQTGGIPLAVESSGRVVYGDQELCPAGAVSAVRIAPARGGDGDFGVRLELRGGILVDLPSTYFAHFGTPEQTRMFAQELARALGVEVHESACA
jgi:hypothetical protein